jgi:hypothetical protein
LFRTSRRAQRRLSAAIVLVNDLARRFFNLHFNDFCLDTGDIHAVFPWV